MLPSLLDGKLQGTIGVAAELGEMVIFDEDGIEEADAVIGAPPDTDRVLFKVAPAGRCLAGVTNDGFGAMNTFNVTRRERGDAAQVAEKIEHGPFDRKKRSGGSMEMSNGVAFLNGSIGAKRGDFEGRIPKRRRKDLVDQ